MLYKLEVYNVYVYGMYAHSQPHTYTPTHALMLIQRGKGLKGNRAIC